MRSVGRQTYECETGQHGGLSVFSDVGEFTFEPHLRFRLDAVGKALTMRAMSPDSVFV